MRKRLILTLIASIGFPLFRTVALDSVLDAVYQVAVWEALEATGCQGFVSADEVLRRADFGYGRFAKTEQDAIFFEGRLYRVEGDARISVAAVTNKLCFAAAKLFEADQSGIRAEVWDRSTTTARFDEMLMTRSLPVALKLDGDFAFVTVAAASKTGSSQESHDTDKITGTVTLTNVTGTILGFRYPEYLKGVGPTGYRLYFLKRDKTRGGPVVDFQVRNMRFEFDYSHRFHLELPAWGEFYSFE